MGGSSIGRFEAQRMCQPHMAMDCAVAAEAGCRVEGILCRSVNQAHHEVRVHVTHDAHDATSLFTRYVQWLLRRGKYCKSKDAVGKIRTEAPSAGQQQLLKCPLSEVGMLRDTLVDLLFLREEELQALEHALEQGGQTRDHGEAGDIGA